MPPGSELKNVAGGSRSLESLTSAGPVLLAFFKISCPVCQLTLPFLDRIGGGSVRVVGISQDDAESTQEFLDEYGPSVETLIDPYHYRVSDQFGIGTVPSLFQVEPGGAISHAWSGFSRADMEKLGGRAGKTVFHETDRVPAYKPG